MIEDGSRRGDIEAIEEGTEFRRRHPFRERGRPADIGEEEARLDLGAAVVLGDVGKARVAERRVLVRWSLADRPHERGTRTAEGGGTDLAARPARDVNE
jgi:hypothetical protein